MNPCQCQQVPLEQIFNDHCDVATEKEIQLCLDRCPTCQERLEQLAADRDTWNEAAVHLGSSDEIALDPATEKKLANTRSVFLASDLAGESASGDTYSESWVQLLDPPAHPEALGKIDHFEIDSKIGQGGMGIVLKGFDRELDRAVAVKVLAPHLASNGTARKRFAREAQAAAAVVHPNVVPIYSVNKNAERPYLVMQLVSGRSLQSVVDEDGPLAVRDVVRIAIQIADGLAAAHEQGLIHRDVKPANVLTERDVTRVMITDFGLARAVDDVGMTQTGWLTGTPHYMSPEQAKGDDVDPRTDLFSLGSLMYFLATGRVPFRATRSFGVIQKIINEQPALANSVNPHVTPELASIIAKLHEKNPGQRFQSASELADLLRDYLSHLQQPNQPMPPIKIAYPQVPAKTTGSHGPRDTRWPALILLLVCFGGIGILIPTAAFVWKLAQPSAPPATVVTEPEELGQTLSHVPQAVLSGSIAPTQTAIFPSISMENDSLIQDMRKLEKDLDNLESLYGIPNTKPDDLPRFK